MKNKITRRNLLQVLGLGAVGAGMLPISCASPQVSDEIKKTPVLRFAHITDLDGDNAKTGTWIVPGAWMHTDAKSLVNLFYNHKNVKACISGHIHLVESLVYNDVHYHCSGAVCGNWWKEEPYEQTNKGYAVFELFDDGTHTFKYVEYDV